MFTVYFITFLVANWSHLVTVHVIFFWIIWFFSLITNAKGRWGGGNYFIIHAIYSNSLSTCLLPKLYQMCFTMGAYTDVSVTYVYNQRTHTASEKKETTLVILPSCIPNRSLPWLYQYGYRHARCYVIFLCLHRKCITHGQSLVFRNVRTY